MSESPAAVTSQDVLARLAGVIESRRGGDSASSYVAHLFDKGTDAILKKIGDRLLFYTADEGVFVLRL